MSDGNSQQNPRARQERSSGGDAPPFRRLLVPLDGSHLAESALSVATRLAQAFPATLVLLHIIERNAPPRIHGEPHLTTTAEADAYLERVAETLRAAGVAVETHTHEVPEGNVARSVAAHAEEGQIDLIVLSTHGVGGLRDVLWGSIAQQVLQRGTVPVLLTRADAAKPTTPFAPRSIMVPLDATGAAERALRPAAFLARALGATLRLVMVVATPGTVAGERQAVATLLPGATRALLDVEEDQAATYLAGLADELRREGISVVTEVRRGDAAAQLATDTGEHADGLVVVATHGKAGLQAIWSGSVAARLLSRTTAPVLLVPIVEGS